MSNYITIGMDLGNRKHTVCAINGAGEVLWRNEVTNTPEALKPFFEENAGATVAMETGLCCRWISALASLSGLHWAWCIGRGPHLQLRQEPQGTSDFRLRSQGPCRLGTGESGLVLG